MSNTSPSPSKHSSKVKKQNNSNNKFNEHAKARTFIQWYKWMIDTNRQNFALYLSDDATLEWFGRTVKTRKKVSSFLSYDMQHTRHYFTTVEWTEKFESREGLIRKEETVIASAIETPERPSNKKRRLQCNSPEWAPGCKPDSDSETKKTKVKSDSVNVDLQVCQTKGNRTTEISNNGDGILEQKDKHKCVPITPPNREIGQGDCMPSTSESDSKLLHLNVELPKLAVECNGYIEFTRLRNNRSVDGMKWERKCKLQVSYSEDQLNVGEYIIWAMRYTDESKCRRNLMAAFEKVAAEESKNPK